MPEEKTRDMRYIADQLKMLSEQGSHVALMYLPDGEAIDPTVLERALNADLNAYLRQHGYRAEVSVILDEETAKPEDVAGLFDNLKQKMAAAARVEGRRVVVLDLIPNPNWNGDDPAMQEPVTLSERQVADLNMLLLPRYRVVEVGEKS